MKRSLSIVRPLTVATFAGRQISVDFENVVSERPAIEAQVYFDLAEIISRSVTSNSLQQACKEATKSLGFDYYLFGGYYPMVESIVMSSNYPASWRERYDSSGYVSVDPVVRHCWSDSKRCFGTISSIWTVSRESKNEP